MSRPTTIEEHRDEGRVRLRVHPWEGAERLGRRLTVAGGLGSLLAIAALVGSAVLAWRAGVQPGWLGPLLQTFLAVSLLSLFAGRAQQGDVWSLVLQEGQLVLPDRVLSLHDIEDVEAEPWAVVLHLHDERVRLPTGRVEQNATWLATFLGDAVDRGGAPK